MRRAAIGVMVVVLALFAAGKVRPWLTAARDFPSSVPSPAAVTSASVVRVAPGKVICASSLAVESHSEQLRFKLDTGGRPGPALHVSLNGDRGYHARATVAAGYPDATLAQVPIPAPGPGSQLVQACIRNEGRRSVGLFASADRTQSRSVTTVDGAVKVGSVWMAFYERSPRSIASRASVIVHRMSVFRPGFVGPWLWWPLLALLVLGGPALLLAAVWRALGDDEVRAPG